ncbi:MAG: metallophosphoesterase [Phycisphaerae bacterium]
MKLTRRSFVKISLLVPLVCAGGCNFTSLAPSHKRWTIAVIPDTQYYVRNDEYAPIFTEVTRWLADHKQDYNIQLVLHLGDIVDRNNDHQWTNAKRSLQVLDGKLPYVLSVGNHDLGSGVGTDRSTMLNDYFKLSDNSLNEKIFGGSFEEGKLENAWYHFECEGRNYVIFSLEFGPRTEVIQWAKSVADKNLDKSFILVTHEFIDQESTLFSDDGFARHTTPHTKNNPHAYGINNFGTVHCGEELFDAFISKYSNFELVLNGHYKAFDKTGPGPDDVKHRVNALAVSRRRDSYKDSRSVHQMLFNAQWAPKGGNGWIQLLEFEPDGKVQVQTISPYLMRTSEDKTACRKTGPDMQYSFVLPAPIHK